MNTIFKRLTIKIIKSCQGNTDIIFLFNLYLTLAKFDYYSTKLNSIVILIKIHFDRKTLEKHILCITILSQKIELILFFR